jgi:hypothetical protein
MKSGDEVVVLGRVTAEGTARMSFGASQVTPEKGHRPIGLAAISRGVLGQDGDDQHNLKGFDESGRSPSATEARWRPAIVLPRSPS